MDPRCVLVTGMQRSGTTLLEKLLCNHPALSILSQPFPLLHVEAKRAFLRSLGHDDAYPLGNLFGERRYRPDDFARFLRSYRPDAAALRRTFETMASYSGQQTRFDDAAIADAAALAADSFPALLASLHLNLAGRAGADLCGSKEILCEELVPPLLDAGWRALVIVRDPRDVLASMNSGRGKDYAGELKPTLFNVRNWRKSVAFALHLEARERFAWMRYEDLVAAPQRRLDAVFETLGVASMPVPRAAAELRDQAGAVWRGNSSHQPHAAITTRSVGGYAEHLPAPVVRFVEATCYPELRLLGYSVSIDPAELEGAIRGFSDPYPVVRADLVGYDRNGAERQRELERLALLREAGRPDPQRLFAFDEVRARLGSAL